MNINKHILLFILFNCVLCSCMKGKKVDQIFHNASIICMDDNSSSGEAMAIENGEIIEIGPERQILNKYRATDIVDVEGKEIVPSFTDCSLTIDSLKKWNQDLLETIETEELEQGVAEIFVHGITYKQLCFLKKFEQKMQLKWHVYLTPTIENMQFIRRKKRNNNHTNLLVAGFTVSNQNESRILEACSIAKNKFLQIGIDYTHGKKHIPLVIHSLHNYKLDHRWFVFNLAETKSKTLKLLEEQNFLLCLTKLNKITFPIYAFGTHHSSDKLLENLVQYSKLSNSDQVNTLKSITNWAHYLSFSEKLNGTLEKGKNANFTILDSPLGKKTNLQTIYASAVYRNGKEIYSME